MNFLFKQICIYYIHILVEYSKQNKFMIFKKNSVLCLSLSCSFNYLYWAFSEIIKLYIILSFVVQMCIYPHILWNLLCLSVLFTFISPSTSNLSPPQLQFFKTSNQCRQENYVIGFDNSKESIRAQADTIRQSRTWMSSVIV